MEENNNCLMKSMSETREQFFKIYGVDESKQYYKDKLEKKFKYNLLIPANASLILLRL
jgi:hypothetical protein